MTLLEILHVAKVYTTAQGQITALQDVTLTIEQGEILSFTRC
jgi:ABC-type dipeptide/oligopeptide/nickel transport system ATPase subunit